MPDFIAVLIIVLTVFYVVSGLVLIFYIWDYKLENWLIWIWSNPQLFFVRLCAAIFLILLLAAIIIHYQRTGEILHQF